MGYAIKQAVTLETEECCKCGILFAMPDSLQKRARADSSLTFYCPNGHPQCYMKSEADRLRAMLAEANQRNTQLADRAHQAELAEQRAVDATAKSERERKRLLKRAHAGVCSCCNRTFQNLARHMATKHAEASTERHAPAVSPTTARIERQRERARRASKPE